MIVIVPDGHCGARSRATASLAERLDVIGQVQAADVLVARRLPAAAGVGVAPALVLVALDRIRLDARPDVGDRLVGVAAVARREDRVAALGGVGRLGEGDALDRRGQLVGGQQVADLRLERDRERVLHDRRRVRPVGGRPVVELDPMAQRGGRRLGDPDGLGGDPVDLGGLEPVAAGEAPRAVDQDPDPEALALARGDALDPARLDRDRLVDLLDDPDVGVRRALDGCRRQGAVGQVSHRRHDSRLGGQAGAQNAGPLPIAWLVSHRPRLKIRQAAPSGA